MAGPPVINLRNLHHSLTVGSNATDLKAVSDIRSPHVPNVSFWGMGGITAVPETRIGFPTWVESWPPSKTTMAQWWCGEYHLLPRCLPSNIIPTSSADVASTLPATTPYQCHVTCWHHHLTSMSPTTSSNTSSSVPATRQIYVMLTSSNRNMPKPTKVKFVVKKATKAMFSLIYVCLLCASSACSFMSKVSILTT